jgi:hypothetical protein
MSCTSRTIVENEVQISVAAASSTTAPRRAQRTEVVTGVTA